MDKPKISIIIPTWNGEKTLGATIKSCLNQTLQPFEIIICDDGSTDNSKKIVEEINSSRVIWAPNQHTGTPAIPRNKGMEISKGEWIAFCDSDDEWMPTKLEKQMEQINKSKNKAVCTNAIIKKYYTITTNKISNWNKKNIKFKNILNDNKIICSSVIINRSIYNKIGGFPEDIKYAGFEDYIYWLRVSTETDFYFVDKPLVIYDDHPETSIRALFKDGKLLKEKTLANFINWVKSQNNIRMYYYVVLVRIYLAKEWVKNTLRYIIKLCYKK